MANRLQPLTLPPRRTYSRIEFTALRARVNGLPIARRYFDPDTAAPLDVDRLLRMMRDDLVATRSNTAHRCWSRTCRRRSRNTANHAWRRCRCN